MLKTNKKLLIVMFVFIFPVILSGILFHYHTCFHLKTLNRGTLLSTPIDVTYLYSSADKTPEKKWRVVYVGNEVCDSQCQHINHQLLQVQKALGKDRDRISTIYMNNQNEHLPQLQASLAVKENPHFAVNDKIYLIDPLGNLFMYYPSDVNLVDVLKDLKRVLEVSQIG